MRSFLFQSFPICWNFHTHHTTTSVPTSRTDIWTDILAVQGAGRGGFLIKKSVCRRKSAKEGLFISSYRFIVSVLQVRLQGRASYFLGADNVHFGHSRWGVLLMLSYENNPTDKPNRYQHPVWRHFFSIVLR